MAQAERSGKMNAITTYESCVLSTEQPIQADCNACRHQLDLPPYDLPSVNRRKDSEVSRLLSILDNLETGKDNQ